MVVDGLTCLDCQRFVPEGQHCICEAASRRWRGRDASLRRGGVIVQADEWVLRSPTVAAMRESGLRDEHIEALLTEVWARGVTVTHGRRETHVEWHAGTAVLPAAGAEAAGDGG